VYIYASSNPAPAISRIRRLFTQVNTSKDATRLTQRVCAAAALLFNVMVLLPELVKLEGLPSKTTVFRTLIDFFTRKHHHGGVIR
jgi:hypothetical protein